MCLNWSGSLASEVCVLLFRPGKLYFLQPLAGFACRRAVIIHYLLLANAWQICGATAVKSVRVIAWKAIMRVSVGAGTDAKQ